MTHSKTIKRPDGVSKYGNDKYLIAVEYKNGRYTHDAYEWSDDDVSYHSVINHDITPEEIHAAKMELWEKMKPEL